MLYPQLVNRVADLLKDFDAERPVHKKFKPGIGPFGEPQIVKIIADRLTKLGIKALTKPTPDLIVVDRWAIEFKIV